MVIQRRFDDVESLQKRGPASDLSDKAFQISANAFEPELFFQFGKRHWRSLLHPTVPSHGGMGVENPDGTVRRIGEVTEDACR